ncbi:MAG TPA: ABC transporter ATP-binding protein [Dongiaceae bacterium]|jgi:putative spermidine/putrescine transport system ATP-binding protein|nr:ABC transporter ATP-binding protein [Dongiaceae bacterium]
MATLSLNSLTRRFGATVAVSAMSLDVADGEFVCLLGPSGCGKSTALRCIAGFEEPDGGDILIDGASTVAIPPNRRATGMVFQSHALWSHMTVFGNIAFGLKLRKLADAAIRRKVGEVLDLLSLSGLESRYPRQLSGGQQQRVALARSLVLEPKILLLDEPFSSLDAHLRVRLREELRAIQRRLNQTTVFVTHDQEEALTLADRIAIMNAGTLEQIDTPGAVYERPETLFVAGFIGAMNVLPARLIGHELQAGPFRLPLSGERRRALADLQAIDLAARPEEIELLSRDNAQSEGRVEQVIDLGPMRHVVVACDDGMRLKVQAPRQVPVAPGDEVGLGLQRALVYRDGAQPVEIVRRHPSVLPFRRAAGAELRPQ